MFGPVKRKQNRVDAPLTKSRIVKDAQSLALKVVAGDILGVECALEQESYVI